MLLRVTVLAALLSTAACQRHIFVTLTGDAARPLVLRGVRVLDARNAVLFDGTLDVLIREGRIAAMGPGLGEVPGAAELAGGVVIPGLVDAHVHVGGSSAPPWLRVLPNEDETLQAFLYCGVTTVLDTGSLTPSIFRLRDAVARGATLGPRLFAVGPLFSTPGGHPGALLRELAPSLVSWFLVPRMTREVADAAQAAAAVDALAAEKPDAIKIAVDHIPLTAPRLPREVIAAIVQQAHARGLRALAHVGSSADLVDAVAAGVDALVHDVYVEELSEAALDAITARRIPVVATISVFDNAERFGLDRTPDYSPLERQVGRPDVLAAMAPVPADFDRTPMEGWIRAIVAGHDARRTNVARLRARGITVLAGSDSPNAGHFPGAGLHQELDLLIQAGMTPAEALRAATFDNARFLAGEKADFGEVAVGKRADLVVLAGDRLDNAAALHDIRSVILGGVLLARHPR